MLKRPSGSSYSTLEATLRRCLTNPDVAQASQVHATISARGLARDRYLGNLLVELYGKCGRVGEASEVFHGIHKRNIYSWNNILTACSRSGAYELGIQYFRQMQLLGEMPDKVSLVVVLDCCASCKDRAAGEEIHCNIIKENLKTCHVSVANALIHMYSSCGVLSRAKEIFDGVDERDVVTWSSMIAAYCQNGHFDRALVMLPEMDLVGEKPSFVTHISLLEACAGIGCYDKAVMIHKRILDAGHDLELNLANAIVSMYGKFGDVASAWKVFHRMRARNLVSWNAIIAANAINGHSLEALKIFQRLDFEGIKPSKVTFLSLLEACAGSSTPIHSRYIHERVTAAGFHSDTVLANALINAHGRSGSLDRAGLVFDLIERKTVSSWSTMIEVHAQSGQSIKALELFTFMILDGFAPSDVTFISVLCACSHDGIASRGWEYFRIMVEDFGITPVAEHYGCLIDLFGRAGWLDEAIAFAASSAIHGSHVAWTMLLAAAKTHGDEELGGEVARRAVELNPDAQTCFVLLSNLYTEN